MNKIRAIDACRLCGSETLIPFIDFGDVPLANNYLAPGEVSEGRFPLEIVRCGGCRGHQLKHDVNPEILFKNYLYITSKGLETHFKNYASSVTTLLGLGEYDHVLEVGGNTGLLCQEFKKLGMEVTNVEPAENIAKISVDNGIKTYNNFFGSEFAESYLQTNKPVDLVVSNNVMAHSPTVSDMVDGIKAILKPGGVFVMENAYFFDTLRNNDFGQFYHEHYHYHCITSLYIFFKKRGMTLYDVAFNDAQCGSFRIFVRNAANVVPAQSVSLAMWRELDYFHSDRYSMFGHRIEKLRVVINNFLVERLYKKIAFVGVPAKAALLIHRFGLQSDFFAAFDDAPLKCGRTIPGTKIVIRPMSELKTSGAEIAFLGAYNFADFIIDRFKDLDITWVTPLPEFKVYGRD